MNKRVSVTGLGTVGCNGVGVRALFQAALENRSGIQDGLGRLSEATLQTLKNQKPELEGESLPVLLSFAAIQQAMQQAGWDHLNPDDGIILATTTGQIPLWEPGLIRFLKKEESAETFSEAFGHQPLGDVLDRTLRCLIRSGHLPRNTLLLTSACSAATQALGIGASWIRSGKVKRCLVGGVEVLSTLTVEGFRSLQILSPKICTPFDRDRKGINLSEGAAFLCLEGEKAGALAFLSGFGFSTDAYHLASPHPEGLGSLQAMKRALDEASLSPNAIEWVHAHGTGSQANDRAEGLAVHSLFGKDSATSGPWVSSTKNIHGHALGASGALESVLCIQSLMEDTLLATAGLQNADPEIPVRHPRVHRQERVRHLLKNTLGFGGNNASLVISRGDA